ncbi:P-loop containing nucleoside triphosphate hydrolase protein [Lophiotrema nucula]|uniref:P-loop containing nucleoside triphosphate hydrolase protein n=1 Tax=Lophiotrema nucula TaxID=690887 RepID=A0A6A5YN76_9PLEO|nr:P-loop containing nucleoside triphosphate hydrolase protein [Lophiotrema nucula]
MNRTRCDISPLSADAAFGPIVEGCRHDFTFTFEQYFFSIVPSILFLLLAPIRANTLRKRRNRVGGNVLRTLKLVAIGIYAVLQLVTLIMWATTNIWALKTQGLRTHATVATSLSFVASLALFGLSYLEHSKSLRPSALLNFYLFFTVVFDAVVLRTLWTVLPFTAVRDLFTASFALKGVIFFLEAKEKRNYLRARSELGPEETSGLYSQSFVWWLNKIIREGYRHVLKPADLYPVDESMSSAALNKRFWTEWDKVVIKLLRWPMLVPVIPRLALLGFTFCQPLMVERLLAFLQIKSQPVGTGYGLVGAYAVVYFGMSISNSLYLHRSYRFLTMLRGTLVSAIYTKTTELSITAIDNSAAVTLMSTDVEFVVLGLRGLHDLWAHTIQLVLATYLLGQRLGWACVGPTVVVFAAAAGTVVAAFFIAKLQTGWNERTQKRIGVTSNMLGHIKGIKMSGLTRKLTVLVQALRIREIKQAQRLWSVNAIVAALAYSPTALSPVATFVFYAVIASRDGTVLDAPKMFTALALLILLTQPLFVLFEDVLALKSTFACVDRIEKYLVAETRKDQRIRTSPQAFNASTYDTVLEPRDRHLQQTTEDIQLKPYKVPRTSVKTTNISSEAVVSIENGTFGWTEEATILSHIDLQVRRSCLTLLVGPVASGKTTLLKSILGEVPHSSGAVALLESEIAYCDQTPWLTNASVKDNIVGLSRLDNGYYDKIVYSCDLEQDISTFPNGHDTLIGSKGISLSTGQKQRIAIARAVYAQKNLIIFDDVFSGLDVNTQRNVFTRLLGSYGLLRQWKTTVLIATHAVNLLPFSDHIIALSSEGRLVEQGTFEQLNAVDGYVRKFCLEHVNEHTVANAEDQVASFPTSAATEPNVLPTLAVTDDKRRQLGDWSVYQYYFGTVGRWGTAIFISLALGWAFLATFPTVWLKWYADANAKPSSNRTGYYIGVYSALQLAWLADLGIFIFFSFRVIASKSGLKLHEITLKTVMQAPMSFFSKTDTGSITTRFSQDMQMLDAQLPLALMIVAGGFLSCFGQIGLIASGAYYVSICFPFLFGVYYLIQKYYLRTSRQMRFLDLEEKAPVYTQFIESLSGLATIRAFSWQKALIEKNHTLVDKSQKPFYLMFMIQTWLTLVLDLITTALAIIVVGVSVKMRDSVSVGFTGVSLTQIISFTANLRFAILFWTQMETSIGAVARVKRFEEETDKEDLVSESNDPPPEWPNRGELCIKDLTVSYGTNGTRKALDNVSVTVAPGHKLAIVGRTGSGKSTLLLSLFRMIEISSGKISIDNIDISTIPRHHIRSRLNAIGEDPYFLDGSIRLNLDPYGSATDEDIVIALEKVNLWDTVQAKGGLDADLTEDMLSHGQKQIFVFARALLRRSQIVVMDEVTSAMDRDTDALMQKLMREEFKGKTVVTIAHRVDTIMDYDNVLVLKGGETAEYGPPNELRERNGGLFKEMLEKGL